MDSTTSSDHHPSKAKTRTSPGPSSPPSWFRGAIQGKTRIALAWIFAIVLALTTRNYPSQLGVLVCFVGATIRFWASGFLRKDSRPAVGGPYGWVRNPLYLGTYLMAIGTAMAVGAWALMIFVTVLYAVIYHYIILDEETKLRRIFGAPYELYCSLVPRFFPRIIPPFAPGPDELVQVNPDPAHHEFSWSLAHKNKAYEAYLSFFGLIGGVALIAYLWQRFGSSSL